MTLDPQDLVQRIANEASTRSPRRVPIVEAVGLALASRHDANGGAFPRGTVVSASVVEQLVRGGLESVEITPRPCMAVVSTGEEDTPGVVGLTLIALAREAGIAETHHFQADSVPEDVAFVLDHVARADLVLFVGDTGDLVRQGIAHHGATVLFEGTVTPDHPLMVAKHESQLIFVLPGGVPAARSCFQTVVTPLAHRMTGQIDPLQQEVVSAVYAVS